MEVSGQLHAPAALPPEREPRYRLGRDAGWAVESRSGGYVEEKYRLRLSGIEPRPSSRKRKYQEDKHNCTLRKYIIDTRHRIYFVVRYMRRAGHVRMGEMRNT
jgi:hypothetical protein